MAITRKPVVACWLAGCLALGIAPAVHADVPRNPPIGADPFQEVLERIRGHAADDGWQKDGWRDEQIEAWLDKLVGTIAKGADLPGLTLPVRQADVTATGNERLPPGFPLQDRLLLIGKDIKQTRVRRSIILADGNVEVTSAEDCVIVARGTASVMMARRTVIVSGVSISLQSDMAIGADAIGTLVVTPGWAQIGSGRHTILVALEHAEVRSPRDMVFVNREVPAVRLPFGMANTTRSVEVAGIPLHPLSVHPLSSKLELLGIVHAEANEEPLAVPRQPARSVVFRYDGRRYVADIGEPIVDEAGREVGALKDWRLATVAGNVAIFSNGDLTAVARMAAK